MTQYRDQFKPTQAKLTGDSLGWDWSMGSALCPALSLATSIPQPLHGGRQCV